MTLIENAAMDGKNFIMGSAVDKGLKLWLMDRGRFCLKNRLNF